MNTSSSPLLLAIETSCDECSAALVRPAPEAVGQVSAQTSAQVSVVSHVVHSQIELHKPFGGVVPENASRNHLEMINTVVAQTLSKAGHTLQDVNAIAVTNRPGLIGALLVGVSAAKAYAYALNIPLVPVDHLNGHLHSVFIAQQKNAPELSAVHLPLLVCLVSGGHTSLYLVKALPPKALQAELLTTSRDDAAGEAFDKGAKLMGLPYPGGRHIDELAKKGNPTAFKFPRPLKGKSQEFSFSGLKTAVAQTIEKLGYKPHVFGTMHPEQLPQGQVLFDLCASLQAAIVDSLMDRIHNAVNTYQPGAIAIVGGVSANTSFRAALDSLSPLPVIFPDSEYCTDNAAMIGAAGLYSYLRGEYLTGSDALTLNAHSRPTI